MYFKIFRRSIETTRNYDKDAGVVKATFGLNKLAINANRPSMKFRIWTRSVVTGHGPYTRGVSDGFIDYEHQEKEEKSTFEHQTCNGGGGGRHRLR